MVDVGDDRHVANLFLHFWFRLSGQGVPAGKPGLETQILLILPEWGSKPEGSKTVMECRI